MVGRHAGFRSDKKSSWSSAVLVCAIYQINVGAPDLIINAWGSHLEQCDFRKQGLVRLQFSQKDFSVR